MARKLLPIALAGVLSCLAVLWGAVASIGYIDQNQVQIRLTGPSGRVSCGDPAKIVATVVNAVTGQTVRNQKVAWSIKRYQSRRDRLTSESSYTNRTGTTSTKLRFGPKAGIRRIGAKVTVTSASIEVRCRGGLNLAARRG